jgi:hypothetical protein
MTMTTMISKKTRFGLMAIASVVAMSLILTPTTSSVRGDDRAPCALADLTAVWWQWLYSVPLPENPSFDTTGEYAFENQPFPGLVFLAGTSTQQDIGSDVYGKATRSITVRRGTAFFFPLINTEWDNVMFDTPTKGTASVVNNPKDGGLTIPQLYATAAGNIDSAAGLYCTLTPKGGTTVNVPYQRVKSPVFAYFLPADNIYEAYDEGIEGIVWPAVSDGYWSYIPPLPPGTYQLNFGGNTPLTGGTFYEEITYNITVR